MDCQDWDPVVLRTRGSHKTGNSATKNPVVAATRRLEEEEMPILKKLLSTEMRHMMISTRVAKGWNQQQLATHCALPVTVIRDIENGRIVPTGAQLNTLNRFLGISLKLEERKSTGV